MSFPVFWEYSFKAALKIAWNFKDDAFNGGFEDIGLVESQVSERVGAVYNICAQKLYVFTLPQIQYHMVHITGN